MPGHRLLGRRARASCVPLRSRSPCCAAAPARRAYCRICPRSCPTGSRPERTTFQASRGCSPGSAIIGAGRRAYRAAGAVARAAPDGAAARAARLEVFASPDPARQTAVLSVRCRDMDSELLAQGACALRHRRACGAALRAGRAPHGRNAGDWHGAPEPVAPSTRTRRSRARRACSTRSCARDNADYVLKSAGL